MDNETMNPNREVWRAEQARRQRMDVRSKRSEWSRWWNGELRTLPKSRKVWAKAFFDKMVADGIISVWRWAPGERQFITPMTMPPLTPDQLTCVLLEFFNWDEAQPD